MKKWSTPLMVFLSKGSCCIITSRVFLLEKHDLHVGPGRREIGHGTLAERGLTPVVPTKA